MKNLLLVCFAVILVTGSLNTQARGYGRGHHGYYHHGHGGHHGAGYFFGGMVLGALLAPPRYAPPPVVYVPQPVQYRRAVPAAPVVTATAPVSRRLLRDINGNCFERKFDAAGTELRIELPPANCNW